MYCFNRGTVPWQGILMGVSTEEHGHTGLFLVISKRAAGGRSRSERAFHWRSCSVLRRRQGRWGSGAPARGSGTKVWVGGFASQTGGAWATYCRPPPGFQEAFGGAACPFRLGDRFVSPFHGTAVTSSAEALRSGQSPGKYSRELKPKGHLCNCLSLATSIIRIRKGNYA